MCVFFSAFHSPACENFARENLRVYECVRACAIKRQEVGVLYLRLFLL